MRQTIYGGHLEQQKEREAKTMTIGLELDCYQPPNLTLSYFSFIVSMVSLQGFLFFFPFATFGVIDPSSPDLPP